MQRRNSRSLLKSAKINNEIVERSYQHEAIRKVTEAFEDDNERVRDTGKIIYASMFVNGEEINLYNFNYKNDEEYYDIKGKSITKSLMKTL